MINLVRHTNLKHLTFRVLHLYRPCPEVEDNQATDEDRNQGYIDPQDNGGHEEEDDGGAAAIGDNHATWNQGFDRNLAQLLEIIAKGDLDLQTPFGCHPDDEKFRISVVAKNGHPGRISEKDIIYDVKEYLPMASTKVRALGTFKMDMIVLGNDNPLHERF